MYILENTTCWPNFEINVGPVSLKMDFKGEFLCHYIVKTIVKNKNLLKRYSNDAEKAK